MIKDFCDRCKTEFSVNLDNDEIRCPTCDKQWQDEIEPKFRQFLTAIGVSHNCGALMYSEEDAEEIDGYPGYIKFYGSGCNENLGDPPAIDRDYQLADQFEQWCASKNLKVHRGYKDDSIKEQKFDRRFFLAPETVTELQRIRKEIGISIEDLDCA